MQSCLNRSTLSTAARWPQARSAVLIGIALVLALGSAGQSRSQAPSGKATFDGEWERCLKAATRACVLRHAARVAESIEDPRSRVETARSRAMSLASVADAQLKAALITDAAATLDWALQLMSSLADPHGRDDPLRYIVAIQAKAGKFGEALEVARSIGNEYLRARAIGPIAVAKGQTGSIAEALQLVQAVDGKRPRALLIREIAWELRTLAVARGEEGTILGALKEVESIEEEHPPPMFSSGPHLPWAHGPPLRIIAAAQARAGRIPEALSVARSIKGRGDRALALAFVTAALANAGQIEKVLEVVRSVEDHLERGQVLGHLLQPEWMAVYEEKAPFRATRTQLEQIEKVEGAEEAVRIALALPDEEQRSRGLAIVAVAQARAGAVGDADGLVPLIKHQKSRFLALLAIGKAQARAGLSAQSIATFEQALQAARSSVPRDRHLSELAKAQAKAGQISEALRVVQSIEGTLLTAGHAGTVNGRKADHDRRWALNEIARAQAKVGLIAEALQTARSIELPGEILGNGLGVVAEGLAEVGRIDEALSAAEAVTRPYARSRLLASITGSQAAAGKHGEALRIARAVSEPQYRAEALVAAAAAQAEAGLIAEASATCREALQVVQSISYKGQIVSALVAIAGALPN
jgi:tetratricopeptide (TPR) repeat protein